MIVNDCSFCMYMYLRGHSVIVVLINLLCAQTPLQAKEDWHLNVRMYMYIYMYTNKTLLPLHEGLAYLCFLYAHLNACTSLTKSAFKLKDNSKMGCINVVMQ